MIHLEIEHPDRERLVLPLRDGVYLFPPEGGMGPQLRGERMRLVVSGRTVRVEALEGTKLQGPDDPDGVDAVEISPGESLQAGPLRIAVRASSHEQFASPTRVRARPAAVAAPISLEPPSERSTPSEASPPPIRRDRRVRGRDRWILMAIYQTGRLGRRALGRVVTAYRNPRQAGSRRSISDILRKGRFLGREFDGALAEIDAGWCLSCRVCRRVFEPEGVVLETARCLECDRRLECVQKVVEEAPNHRRSPARINLRFDRLPPGVRLGNYKVVHLLGIGGYGAVYQAQDTQMGRKVALKVFPPVEGDEENDVLQEARTVASFPPHANLVMVYHVGRALGLDYICYEYVHGRSLAYHIERGTRLGLERCLSLMRDCLQGLQSAHKFGVIHRDIKPDNILLVQIDGQYRAKLTDFGLGRQLEPWQEGYHSRTIRGAPEYLAPEQFRAQLSSVASDLYSLAATFFHVLTGRVPYRGATDFEFAERHQEDPIPSLTDLLPACTPSLDRLFHRMLAKEPKDRPASVEVVLDLLQEIEAQLADARSARTRRLGSSAVFGGSIVLVGAVLALLTVEWNDRPKARPEESAVSPETAEAPPPDPAEPEAGEGREATPPVTDQTPAGPEPVVDDPEPPVELPPPPRRVRAPLRSRWAPVELFTDPSAPVGGTSLGEESLGEATVLRPEPSPLPPSQPSVPDPSRAEADDPESRGPAGIEGPLGQALVECAEVASLARQQGIGLRVLTEELPPPGSDRSPEQQLALRRLLMVHHLLGNAFLLPGAAPEAPVAALQSFGQSVMLPLRRAIGDERRPSQVATAAQVTARVELLQDLLRRLELDALIRLRLPRLEEVRSHPVELDALQHEDDWEWIADGAATVLYDHERGRVREGSDRPGFTRMSTFRLRLELRDPEALREAIQRDLDGLGGP